MPHLVQFKYGTPAVKRGSRAFESQELLDAFLQVGAAEFPGFVVDAIVEYKAAKLSDAAEQHLATLR